MKIFTIIKENSKRIPGKNFLNLGGIPLWKHLVLEFRGYDFYIDTDSIDVLESCKDLDWVNAYQRDQNFIDMEIDEENKESPVLKMIENFLNRFVDDYSEPIITTHVTSPFLKRKTLMDACSFLEKGFDSVSACTVHKEFCYFRNRPINFNPKIVQRTQDLEPIIMGNGAFFIFTKKSFFENMNRIGKNPYFYELDFKESIEIDYPEDFEMAKKFI
jgi:CMP-N-acetylneuraminic acid synthetase